MAGMGRKGKDSGAEKLVELLLFVLLLLPVGMEEVCRLDAYRCRIETVLNDGRLDSGKGEIVLAKAFWTAHGTLLFFAIVA
jgi:hypothetical protein